MGTKTWKNQDGLTRATNGQLMGFDNPEIKVLYSTEEGAVSHENHLKKS